MTVRNLQHYALSVPDPEAGKQFYEDFGLEGRVDGNQVVMRCAGRDQDQVILIEGAKRKLHHICFGTTEDGLAAIRKQVDGSDDTQLVDAPNDTPGPGLWIKDWEDQLTNVRVAEAAPSRGGPDPTSDQAAWRINCPGHYDRRGPRGYPPRDTVVKPRRLGHVLHFTTDMNRRLAFYQNVLGLRLSDRSGDLVAFMHHVGGSDHHILGLIQSDLPGFHHGSYEVASVDEVGLGACQLLAKGYKDGWGLGRHVIGSNFFHYIRDPWNSLAEYFCDIDYIPDADAWQADDWPAEDSLYVWGPDVPEDFGANFESDG